MFVKTYLRTLILLSGMLFFTQPVFAVEQVPSSPAPAAQEQKTDIQETTAPPQAKPALPPAMKEKLDQELAGMIGTSGAKVPGVSVIVYKDGQKVYEGAFGRRRIDYANPANNYPMTTDSLFRVASLSKLYTTLGVMQLVDEGAIDLDADASQYLGFNLRHPAYPDTPITVRMIASHTSGVRDSAGYFLPPDQPISSLFYRTSPAYCVYTQAPGSYFTYANLNFGLLGTIIERVSGQRFDEYERTHILKDLDTDADFFPAEMPYETWQRLGSIYRGTGGYYATADKPRTYQPTTDNIYGYSLAGYQIGSNGTLFGPQGALRISVKGLGNTLEMLMNDGWFHGKQVVSANSIQEMTKAQWIYNGHNGGTFGGTLLSYGLGMYQIDGGSSARVCRDAQVDLVGHTGEAYGALTGLFFQPGTRNGFAYIINGEAMSESAGHGQFSGNLIWEENIMNLLCQAMLSK